MKFTTQTKIRKAKSTISTSSKNGERERLKRNKKKALMACKVVPEDDGKVDDKAVKHPQFLVSLDHMKTDQREKVLADYPEIFRTEPRRTTVLENMIHLTDSTPIQQRPTREPRSPIEKGDSIDERHGSNRTINHCVE